MIIRREFSDLSAVPPRFAQSNLPQGGKKQGDFLYCRPDKRKFFTLCVFPRSVYLRRKPLQNQFFRSKEANAVSAKYQRIAREIALTLGGRDAGTRLPTEAQLCAQYACSRQTVRSALALLERQGLIVRRQGSGSYPAKSAALPSRRLALLLADREEYTAPAFIKQARAAAQAAGYGLDCLETRGSREREAEQLRALLRQRPAGVLLEPITDVLGCFHDEPLSALGEAGIPLVFLGGSYRPDLPCVAPDEEAGAELLVAHLAAQGHRRFAAILKWDDSRGIRRFRGLLRAAREAGLDFDPAQCLWYGEADRLRLLEGTEGLLRRFREELPGDCTAAVCFNDEIGFRLRRFLQARQEKCSLVSYDNSYLAPTAALTSLSCPALPAAAIAALLHRIDPSAPPPPPLSWKLTPRR